MKFDKMRLLLGHSKTTWSRIVLLINLVVNKYNYITATNVWIHGLIKPQNNEHLRFTSFEEKSALNISGKFECTYEWIFAYFNKYRKKALLEVSIPCKACNDYIPVYFKTICTKSGQSDLKVWQNDCC